MKKLLASLALGLILLTGGAAALAQAPAPAAAAPTAAAAEAKPADAAPATAAPAAAKGAAAPAAAKVEEKEESDEDMGFGLFD